MSIGISQSESFNPTQNQFIPPDFKIILQEAPVEKISFQSAALEIKPSKQEVETLRSYGKAIINCARLGFNKKRQPDGSDIISDGKNSLAVYLPNYRPGQDMTVFVMGKLNVDPSRKIYASITPEGNLRLARGTAKQEKDIVIIQGAGLNFDNGIALEKIRIKLSSGQFKPLLSLL